MKRTKNENDYEERLYYFIAFLLAVVGSTSVKAQEDRTKSITQSYLRGWEYSLKAGFSIGGTAPLPLPEEIRKIDSYVPSMTISIEGNATKWLDEKNYGD